MECKMNISSMNTAQSYSLNVSATTTQTSSQKITDVQNSTDSELIQKVQSGELSSKDIIKAYQMTYLTQASASQTADSSSSFDYTKIKNILSGIDPTKIGYTGADLSTLSKEDAQKLVSDDGFFGVKQTADRISGFVISGAGDDLKKLQAGRQGVVSGYNEAEKEWGGKLPDISKKTLETALAAIDKRIEALGGSAIDTKA